MPLATLTHTFTRSASPSLCFRRPARLPVCAPAAATTHPHSQALRLMSDDGDRDYASALTLLSEAIAAQPLDAHLWMARCGCQCCIHHHRVKFISQSWPFISLIANTQSASSRQCLSGLDYLVISPPRTHVLNSHQQVYLFGGARAHRRRAERCESLRRIEIRLAKGMSHIYDPCCHANAHYESTQQSSSLTLFFPSTTAPHTGTLPSRHRAPTARLYHCRGGGRGQLHASFISTLVLLRRILGGRARGLCRRSAMRTPGERSRARCNGMWPLNAAATASALGPLLLL